MKYAIAIAVAWVALLACISFVAGAWVFLDIWQWEPVSRFVVLWIGFIVAVIAAMIAGEFR